MRRESFFQLDTPENKHTLAYFSYVQLLLERCACHQHIPGISASTTSLKIGHQEHGLRILFQTEQLYAKIKSTTSGVDPRHLAQWNGGASSFRESTWPSETAVQAAPRLPHFRTLQGSLKTGKRRKATYVLWPQRWNNSAWGSFDSHNSHPTGQ